MINLQLISFIKLEQSSIGEVFGLVDSVGTSALMSKKKALTSSNRSLKLS